MPARVRTQVDALAAKCRERGIRFDMRPKVRPAILDNYYTPGTPLDGRCLYPFLYARVSFSGKAYFCPFIRVEVGDLTTQSLEEVWTGETYVALRKKLRRRTDCFPSAGAAARSSCPPEPAAARRRPSPADGTWLALGGELTIDAGCTGHCSSTRRSSAASRSRGRAAARSARKCSARPSRRTRWRSCAALLRERGLRRPPRRPDRDAADRSTT